MAREYRPKPATAAWIQSERKRRQWSAQDLVDKLAVVGVNVSRQTIQVWESYAGRLPSAQNLDALERIFQSKAPEKAATTDEVAAAIREQTEALTALLVELREERAAAAAETARLLGLLGAALGLRADLGETPAEAEPAGAGDTRRGQDLRALLPQG